MRLVWEKPNQGLARGFSDDGPELAQVAHVYNASGDDLGWIVKLTHDQAELFDHYDTIEQAMGAAEAALDRT